jgi:protein-S-isoprenylcysteine O-methyltransferase Ste14
MAATVIVAPSPAVLLVAVMHTVLVMMKVSSEERFLIARHGAAYQEYCKRTGRFLPWPKTTSRQPAGT